MNQYDDIDDARAALIDHRIGQSFEFLGDIIADPRLLDAIPDGSRLAFRDVAIGPFRFRLTAYRPPDARDCWHALVTGRHDADSQDESETPPNPPLIGRSGAAQPVVATGKTATSALDALEAELRALVTIPA